MGARWARAAALAAASLVVLAATGCTATMADLKGDRNARALLQPAVATPQVSADGQGATREAQAVFTLRNGAWGPVRVESARAPIGTRVQCNPPLPATVKAGGTLVVTVIAQFSAAAPADLRTVLLETRGSPPLALVVHPETAK